MYGLVLEGGGAKGSYHLGAYKAIREMGIEVKGITGTSVGALNGALITQGDFDKAYDLWENINYSQVINLEDDRIQEAINGDMGIKSIGILRDYIKDTISYGGIDVTPLKELINSLVDEDRMRNSDIEFGMVTISLSDFRPLEVFLEDIPKGRVSDYLLASAYFPAFKSERLDGKYYLDGGLYNNLPVDLLKNKGYKDIIQVRTFGIGHVKRLDTSDLNIISIEPREDLGGTLEFKAERASYNLKLGYYDGLKVLRGLKGNKYYIESDLGSEEIDSYLWNLDRARIGLLKKALKIKEDTDSRRVVFEQMIPRIANIVGAKKEDSYEVIFYLLLDELGSIYEVDRFKLYSLDAFLDIIRGRIISDTKNRGNILTRLGQKSSIRSLLSHEEMLKEVGFILF